MSILEIQHYEVRQIGSNNTVYRGTSLATAARELVAGTCYGKGPTAELARLHAKVNVRKFQNAGEPQ